MRRTIRNRTSKWTCGIDYELAMTDGRVADYLDCILSTGEGKEASSAAKARHCLQEAKAHALACLEWIRDAQDELDGREKGPVKLD